MAVSDRASAEAQQHAKPWIARVSSGLVALAVAMGANLVSSDIGHRGVAVVFAAAGMLSAAVWLKGFRRDFALVVWAVRSLLFVAVLGIIAATMLGARLSGLAVLIAALATLGATLIRSEPAGRLALLSAVALIGLGSSLIADGISPGDPRVSSEGRLVSVILGGMLALVGMLALWAGRSFISSTKEIFRDVFLEDAPYALWMLGWFGALMGVLTATSGKFLFGASGMLFALGIFGVAGGHGRRRAELVGLGGMFVGLSGVLPGIGAVVDGEVLLGAAMVGIGVAFISAGATYLARRGVLNRLRRWIDAARLDGNEQNT